MIRIEADLTKDHFIVKLETGCQAAQVDGYHLTPYLAAELGFEKITGLTDVIEETKHLENLSDGWSVYGIKWDARQACACGKSDRSKTETAFTRVYVHRMKPPKEANAASCAPICPASARSGREDARVSEREELGS